MNFALPDELLELQARTRTFIAEQVIPFENDPRQDGHGPSDALRRDLQASAQAAGLLTPHASREMGGLGLSHAAKAIVFEEAGYSSLLWIAGKAVALCGEDRDPALRSAIKAAYSRSTSKVVELLQREGIRKIPDGT